MRLAVYADNVYRRVDQRVATIDEVYAFMLFVCEAARDAERVVLLGRGAPRGRAVDHLLPEGPELVELPYYESLRSGREVVRAVRGTARAMWRALDDVDTAWVFGPNPFGVVFAAMALARRRRLVLGVRQDTARYFRSRAGSRFAPSLLAATALDLAFRLLARRARVTAVGDELARRYGMPPRVLPMTVSVVRAGDVATNPPERDWSRVGVLAVGRLDVEKDPLTLVDALARLDPARFRLTWVGSGPLADRVRRRAAELGVDVELPGFVPFGDELLGHYRRAHLFVNVSLTEGVPGAIVEALAAGLPVVATAVGGVPRLLEGGAAGVLVEPRDADGIAAAIARVADDRGLRERLFVRGREVASARTLEAEAARVGAFLSAGAGTIAA